MAHINHENPLVIGGVPMVPRDQAQPYNITHTTDGNNNVEGHDGK